MSCVILKWIYTKDKIEEHATENKTICSEWTQLFPFKLNNAFWNNLKHSFSSIFFHISERKMPHNLFCFVGAHDHILHLPMGFSCSSLCFLKKNMFPLPLWFSNWIEIWLFLIVMQYLWTVQKQSAKQVCECHGNTIFLNHKKHRVLHKTCNSSQYLHNYLKLNLTFIRLPSIFHRLPIGHLPPL